MFKHTEDVLHLRDLTTILLGYAGFLRFNEINELKCNDIEFKEDHFILKIRKSKKGRLQIWERCSNSKRFIFCLSLEYAVQIFTGY